MMHGHTYIKMLFKCSYKDRHQVVKSVWNPPATIRYLILKTVDKQCQCWLVTKVEETYWVNRFGCCGDDTWV